MLSRGGIQMEFVIFLPFDLQGLPRLSVQRMGYAIHHINHYPVDKYYQNQLRYSLDSDLSGG